RINNLSRGMKQRVAIGQAIIHNPEILILDEPASGLDPEARIGLANLFKYLNKEGMTILVTSHILAELNEYANQLLVIKQGRIIENTNKMIAANSDSESILQIQSLQDLQEVKAFLQENLEMNEIDIDGEVLLVKFYGNEESKRTVLQKMVIAGLPITEFSTFQTNIQQEYLRIIGEK
ncbi:MAG: ATP-binding cassette domain-containing protein, partial [Spirochaetota bacterium]